MFSSFPKPRYEKSVRIFVGLDELDFAVVVKIEKVYFVTYKIFVFGKEFGGYVSIFFVHYRTSGID